MLSGYDRQPAALYLEGEYFCLKCAAEKLGELRVSKIVAGIGALPGDPEAWDADAVVWRWEVDGKLAEIEAVKNEGRRAHKRFDWDDVNGLEWGTRCDQCGTDLAPPQQHKPDATTTGFCRYCWEKVDHPIHKGAL